MTRDDAKNMQKCGRLLNIEEFILNYNIVIVYIIVIFCSFQCCAHFIHLVVTDAFKNVELSNILSCVKNWVIWSRTTEGRKTFKHHQMKNGIPEKKLKMVTFKESAKK